MSSEKSSDILMNVHPRREFGFEVSRETEMSSWKDESHTICWDYQDYTHHFTYMA